MLSLPVYVLLHNYVNPLISLSMLVIAKVFRQADTDETGHVGTSLLPSLAASVLGPSLKDVERQLIKFHTDSRVGKLNHTTL